MNNLKIPLILLGILSLSITSIILINWTMTNNSDISQVKQSNIINFPVEKFQYAKVESHTGIATLAMLFDYYDETSNISQDDLYLISKTNQDGARGTPIDGYIEACTYDDYINRDFGYQARVISFESYSSEKRWEMLKSYVDMGKPLVVCTRYRIIGNYYIHYRILIGYDERSKAIYVHDPYRGSDISSGPFSDFNFNEFERRWKNIGYSVIEINPIQLEVAIEHMPVLSNTEFVLESDIDVSNLEVIPKNVSLELKMPEEYAIVEGDNYITQNIIGNSLSYNWTIRSPINSEIMDNITVLVRYNHEDKILGNRKTILLSNPDPPIVSGPTSPNANSSNFVPSTFTVTCNISYNNEYGVSLNYYNVSNRYRRLNSYFLGTNCSFINFTLGPFNSVRTVICWITVNTTSKTLYYSPFIPFRVNTSSNLEIHTLCNLNCLFTASLASS